jgi:hypothetical protein
VERRGWISRVRIRRRKFISKGEEWWKMLRGDDKAGDMRELGACFRTDSSPGSYERAWKDVFRTQNFETININNAIIIYVNMLLGISECWLLTGETMPPPDYSRC